MFFFFFFNDTATTEIYTLSLHDALPICGSSETRAFSVALRPRLRLGGRNTPCHWPPCSGKRSPRRCAHGLCREPRAVRPHRRWHCLSSVSQRRLPGRSVLRTNRNRCSRGLPPALPRPRTSFPTRRGYRFSCHL